MANFKVHELWPKPVFEDYIKPKNEWLLFTKECEYERMFSNNGDYTVDKYILNKLPDLQDEILKKVFLFTEKYLKIKDIDFYFTNSWIVQHQPNDWGQPHHHKNSLLSGVYYLDAEENCGDITFIKGYNEQEIFPLAITPEYSEYNYINSTEMNFKVETGKLFIFPSNLMHKIKKNKTNKNRYSLAFNLFCKGTFGKNEAVLKL